MPTLAEMAAKGGYKRLSLAEMAAKAPAEKTLTLAEMAATPPKRRRSTDPGYFFKVGSSADPSSENYIEPSSDPKQSIDVLDDRASRRKDAGAGRNKGRPHGSATASSRAADIGGDIANMFPAGGMGIIDSGIELAQQGANFLRDQSPLDLALSPDEQIEAARQRAGARARDAVAPAPKPTGNPVMDIGNAIARPGKIDRVLQGAREAASGGREVIDQQWSPETAAGRAKIVEAGRNVAPARVTGDPAIDAANAIIRTSEEARQAAAAMAENPFAAATIGGESAVQLGAMFAPAKLATTVGGRLAGAIAGEGALVAGQVGSQTRKRFDDPKVIAEVRATPEFGMLSDQLGGDTAALRALQDQAAGRAAVYSGAATMAIGAIFAKLGIGEAFERQLVGDLGALTGTTAQRIGQAGKRIGGETVSEGLQGGSEAPAQNIAEQQAGLDTPTFKGFVPGMVLEGTMGGALATGINAPQILAPRLVRTPRTGDPAIDDANDAIDETLNAAEIARAELEAQIAGENIDPADLNPNPPEQAGESAVDEDLAGIDALLRSSLPAPPVVAPPVVAPMADPGAPPPRRDLHQFPPVPADAAPAAPPAPAASPSPSPAVIAEILDAPQSGPTLSEQDNAQLDELDREIGWEQRGGGIVRDAEGNVVSRQPWEPRASPTGGLSEFWRNRPDPITEDQARLALQKAKAGEPLFAREKRFVAYAREHMQSVRDMADSYAEEQRALDREEKIFIPPEEGAEPIRYSRTGLPAGWNDGFDSVRRTTDVAGGLEAPASGTQSRTVTQRSPDSLRFRETEQNRLQSVRDDFPRGQGYTPIVAVRDSDGTLTIVDGHNRASVARERGDAIPTVDLSRDQYDALIAEGFDDMEISAAVLMDAGETDAAEAINQQFPGANVESRARDALVRLEDLSYSRGRPATGSTVPQVRAAAVKAWGNRAVTRLERAGILNIITRAEAEKITGRPAEGVKGFEYQGKAYVIADGVSLDRVAGVALHEVGVHYGLERMIGKEAFDAIKAAMRRLRKTDKAVREAYASVPPEDVARGLEDEEAIAYLVEEHPGHGIVQRILDAVAKFLKKIGVTPSWIESESDAIRAMVREAFRNAGRESGAVAERAPAFSGEKAKADPFYSALLRSVEEAKGAPKTGTAAQWKGWLDGAQRRGEFKQAERDWLGVDQWLDGQTSITRDALDAFVRANQVQVNEVALGTRAEVVAFDEEMERKYGKNYVLEMSREEGDRRVKIFKETSEKFEKYQEPGGENYRELLFTMPTGGPSTIEAMSDNELRTLIERNDENADVDGLGRNDLLAMISSMDLDHAALTKLTGKNAAQYKSGHFDQPNILAHVRFNERTDADGKRVLFIEEVQSDWHQEGRKKGYRDSGKPWEVFNEKTGAVVSRHASQSEAQKAAYEAGPGFDAAQSQGVPDAPLKKEWPLAVMKRMLRWAADNGFDRVAWTTGAQQAARYDLSKQVKNVSYEKTARGYYVNVLSLDGPNILSKDMTTAEVEETLGKDILEKMERRAGKDEGASDPDLVGTYTLSGDGLKVGGEGMKAFYDKMLPNELGKYVKKWGASVGTTRINGVAQQSVDVTPAMRRDVAYGQPLFSRDQPDAPRLSRTLTPAEARLRAEQVRQDLRQDLPADPERSFALQAVPTEGVKAFARKTRMHLQDKMLRLLEVQGDMAAAGQAVGEWADAYRGENLMHGRVGERIELLNRQLVKPFVEWMRAKKLATAQVERAAYLMHAEERNDRIADINPNMRDGGSGINTADAKKELEQMKRFTNWGAIERAVKLLHRITAETRKILLEGGIISPALHKAITDQYQNYVPLRGQDGDEQTGQGTGRGLDGRAKAFNRALGRGAGNEATNILGEVINDARRAIVMAEKARVGRQVLRMALENKNKDLWEVEAVETEQKFSEAANEVYLAVRNLANDPNLLVVKHRGTNYKILIRDDELAAALKSLDVEQLPFVIQMLGKYNRYLSAVFTRYNPSFVLVNLARDGVFGLTRLGSEHGAKVLAGAMRNYPAAVNALWRNAREQGPGGNLRMAQYEREFATSGGKTYFTGLKNVQDLQLDAEREVQTLTELMRGGAPWAAVKRAVGDNPLTRAIEATNDTIENALRLAAFASLRDAGKTIEQAAIIAKDLTVNFNRRGASTSIANGLYVFFNASVQGVHAFKKAFKHPGFKAVLGGLAGLQAISTMLLMGIKDDDGVTAWEAIPEQDKSRALIFAWPYLDENGQLRGKTFKLPMPFGMNVFSTAGGRVAEYAYNTATGRKRSGGPDKISAVASSTAKSVAQAFSPVDIASGYAGLLPTVLQVGYNVNVNEDDFGGRIRDQDPYDKSEAPRSSMGRAGTPAAFKWMATALNRLGGGDDYTRPVALLDYAPEDLAYMSKYLVGGLGSFFTGSYGVGQQALSGVDVTMDEIPIVKSFVGEIRPERYMPDQYYRARPRIERARNRYRDTYESQGPGAAAELARTDPAADGLRPKRKKSGDVTKSAAGGPQLDQRPGSVQDAYRDAEKAIGSLRKKRKAIYNDKTLTAGERIRQIEEINQRIQSAMRETVRKSH